MNPFPGNVATHSGHDSHINYLNKTMHYRHAHSQPGSYNPSQVIAIKLTVKAYHDEDQLC